jgi:Rrf2 family protein
MISQTSEYALRAVVHLAQAGGGPEIAQDIATVTRVPGGYLHKILRMLSKDGILVAQRGVGGGFALAKVPTAISVLDVLRATDTTMERIERCPLGIKGHTSLCSLHRMLDEAIADAEKRFAGTSIQDLLNDSGHSRPLCDANGAASVTVTARGGAGNSLKKST